MAAMRYSKVIREGAVQSLANANTLAIPDGVSLPATFLQAQVQLTRNQVI